MSEVKNKKIIQSNIKNPNLSKEYWNEHRVTLIAFQTQYIYQKRPRNLNKSSDNEENLNGRKKELQYEGGFLFPGRKQQNKTDINVIEQVLKSDCNYLRELYVNVQSLSEDMVELGQFIKIMLGLKHSCVFDQFMHIYDFIVRQIKPLSFEVLRFEESRMKTVDRIKEKLVSLIDNKNSSFKMLNAYLKESKRETEKLLKVTTYCLLAELFNFNLNEFYAEAFEVEQEEKKVPKKKVKRE